jgi:uncharacterized protein YecT (DUF1311 family)
MNTLHVQDQTVCYRLAIGVGALVALVLILSCSPKREAADESSEVLPKEWKPSLEQVRTDMREELAASANKNQRALNRASQNLAELSDAQLFITYVRLMESLDKKDRTDLFNDQRKWLGRREQMARAAVVSKGGSLEPVEYSSAFRKITEERLAELEKRLADQQKQKL